MKICSPKKSHMTISRCIFITTPFRLNRRSCLLSESGNATIRNYVQTTCISNWLIWKEKVCKTFLSSSRNISIVIVTQNSLKRVSWPIFWTKYVTLNGEVSVSYINHFNVQNMRQTIKLTPLFCNLVPSLLYIRILSIHFFSKFQKNWWFTKIKETPLFRSVEYNIYSGNDSFESVKKRFLSEGDTNNRFFKNN
jgi:hypothetical protein